MKIFKVKALKSSNGITLIALVITIIVLLILAGISISMLSGDNGILQKATDAKTETERGEVYEQISLATASGEMEYYSNGTDRLTAYKSALLNGVDGIDRDNLTDNGSNLITGTVTTKSGKQYDFSVPVPVTDIIVSEHTEQERPESTIDYGEKTAQTIVQGDDITIGTEKFKVLQVETTTITAMPYYNITLPEDLTIELPLQSSSAGTIAFSTTKYWTSLDEDIDMTDDNNNIQKYIVAYQTTLQNLGAYNVTTRIARYNEMYDLYYSTKISGKSTITNPSQLGFFWMGTCKDNINNVPYVQQTGAVGGSSSYNTSGVGVRPIIVISL